MTIALAFCALAGSGCANLRVPPIDRPPVPVQTVPVQPGAPVPGPVVPGDANVAPALPPGGTMPAIPPAAGTIAPGLPPAVAATAAPAVGQNVPAPTPARLRSGQPVTLAVAPIRSFAPVGTEVVLVAGVAGLDGQFQTGRPIEWMLDSAGVGHFVEVAGSGGFSLFRFGSNGAGKIDRGYATSTTSSSGYTLTRGTPLTTDDVIVYRGQTWVSVSSPAEGTSYVTAYSRDVYGWDLHQQTAIIEWVDAAWTMPPPAVNPVGTRHNFTTTVLRQSTGAPIEGWRVRYEIAGGPAAGFAPDGGQSVEVTTNELGQATAEIMQTQPAAGTNQVNVSIIRPAPPGGGSPVIITTGSTTKTWTAPDIAIQVTGPPQANPGESLTYRLTVTNRGATAARGASVTNPVPAGLSYVSATPPPMSVTDQLQWSLGDINPGESRTLDVVLRADRAGNYNNCANVQTADGLSAQSCANTTVLAPGVSVVTTGPAQVAVGQDFAFDVTITNTSTVQLADLTLVDRFDAGLQHEVSASPIERPLQPLAPGQSQQIQVRFRATQPGQLCHTVEIVSTAGTLGTGRACVTAMAGAVPPPVAPPPVTPQPSTPPATGQAAPGAAVAVTKTGPAQRNVGANAEFMIVVSNSGTTALTDVRVTDNYDLGLEPVEATDGFTPVGQDLVWRIPLIPAGESRQLQVNCRCTQVAPRACNRVTVVSAEGARADGQACVEILAPAPGVSVALADLNDPVAVNQELTYEVRLQNNGATPDQDIALSIELPPELTPIAIGTGGPTSYRIEGQTVRFEALPQLAPGETRTFRLRVRATRPGEARLRATVSSRLVPQPISAEERTTITGP